MPPVDDVRATAIAHGRAIKKKNALTALVCGGVPAAILAALFPNQAGRWVIGFLVGLLWANGFEYVYHRCLLHLPRSFLGRRHLGHHMAVGSLTEAEHVNLGGSPLWVALLFILNGVPVITLDLLFGLGVASGMLVAFSLYVVVVEEIHWRIHLGEWLPPGLRFARSHHFAHHERSNERFNIFLPLFDWFFGSLKSHHS
jgi:hypothetical protein